MKLLTQEQIDKMTYEDLDDYIDDWIYNNNKYMGMLKSSFNEKKENKKANLNRLAFFFKINLFN